MAKLVHENLDFERGLAPKEALSIGGNLFIAQYEEGWGSGEGKLAEEY